MIEGGQVDEIKSMDYRTKPNEEPVTHIFPRKEMDMSSFSDQNSSTENGNLDGKLVTENAFIYKSAQEDIEVTNTYS